MLFLILLEFNFFAETPSLEYIQYAGIVIFQNQELDLRQMKWTTYSLNSFEAVGQVKNIKFPKIENLVISDYSFINNHQLERVEFSGLPNVITIGLRPFYYNERLGCVSIPDGPSCNDFARLNFVGIFEGTGLHYRDTFCEVLCEPQPNFTPTRDGPNGAGPPTDELTPTQKTGGLNGGVIFVIVLAVLIFVGGIAFLVYWFMFRGRPTGSTSGFEQIPDS